MAVMLSVLSVAAVATPSTGRVLDLRRVLAGRALHQRVSCEGLRERFRDFVVVALVPIFLRTGLRTEVGSLATPQGLARVRGDLRGGPCRQSWRCLISGRWTARGARGRPVCAVLMNTRAVMGLVADQHRLRTVGLRHPSRMFTMFVIMDAAHDG